MRLDLACGAHCREGFEGVDHVRHEGVEHVLDLLAFPWPWASGSVEELSCSHFVEHIPLELWKPPADTLGQAIARAAARAMGPDMGVDLLLRFFEECDRVLAPGGTLTVVTPNAETVHAFADPTHRRVIVKETYLYLDRSFREEHGLTGGAYATSVHFPLELAESGTVEPDDDLVVVLAKPLA